MKVFSVSEACNACGECVLRTKLLSEDSGGFAIPTPGLYIQDADLPDAQRVVAQCPAHALSIIEQSSVTSKGKAGLEDLAKILEQKLTEVQIPDVSNSDIAYNEKDYSVDYGYISGEGRYIYASKREAINAGKSQFERVFWNRRPDFVTSILTQYKSKILRKYYDLSEPERTYYAQISRKMEEILNQVLAEASSLAGKTIPVPEDFTLFHPELEDKWFREDTKTEYDKWIVMTSYVTQFCEGFERSDRHRKRDYEDRIYATEDYKVVGTDWLGANKLKTICCFENVNDIGKELVEDILFYLGYAKDCGLHDIDDMAMDHLDFLMVQYRELVKKEIAKKVSEFKDAINKC